MVGSAGRDLRHIQKHYRDYFRSLEIFDESEDFADFAVATETDPEKLVKVRLGLNGFQDTSSGLVYESFEALISALMGAHAFSQLMSRLVSQRFKEA